MGTDIESVAHALRGATANTAAELGAEISAQIGRLVGHDGYQVVGFDPLALVGCLYADENGYSDQANRRLQVVDFSGRPGTPFRRLLDDGPAELLGAGALDRGHGGLQLAVMRAEGFGSELRIALIYQGRAWGAMNLLRERTRRPFSPDHLADAQRLSRSLAATVRRFAASKPLRPARAAAAVGVLIIDPRLTVTAMTPDAPGWLHQIAPYARVGVNEQLTIRIVRSVAYAAQRTRQQVVNRVPTPGGWVALHGQALQGDRPGEVAITIGPAAGSTLLPAAAAWYGITAREQTVIEHALDGLATKQIARRLDLSTYTVNDHLKAIYRKTGVTGRDELTAHLAAP
ncbi:LuxR C-terminal-related transcriptional regulator [Spirillospora sp. NBC_00431]